MEPWHQVYYRLAQLLFEFYTKNGSLSGRKLFELCFSNARFRDINNWIEKFPKDFKVRSLDPIHIFATINSGTVLERTRVERAEIIFEILTDSAAKLAIDFSGCPSPSVIYLVGARSEHMQTEIWDTFVNIYLSKHEGVNDSVFRKIKRWYGVDIPSFTIFLFWIDSSNFLPLDNNTVSILISVGKLKKSSRSATVYLELLTDRETTIYRELALLAYEINKLGKRNVVYSKKLNQYLGLETVDDLVFDCKLVALRLIEDKTGEYFKVLKPNTLYQFYNSFQFESDEKVVCITDKDIDLYNIGRLRVNISAVVGQNGSGKSTLTELLFITINNLAKKFLSNPYIVPVEEVKLQLYLRTTTLFRIDVLNGRTRVYEYKSHDNIFDEPREVNKSFKLNKIFYTVAINYSHYSLNELRGRWLSALFHKNDSYQLPLVINPQRKNGNIDINKENSFVKARLLTNILLPVTDTSENNLRYVNDKRFIKTIVLKLNKDKLQYIAKFKTEQFDLIYSSAKRILKFEDSTNTFRNYLKQYIVHKLIKIAITYEQYQPFYNKSTKTLTISKLGKYLGNLKTDRSHITFKLRQAISLLHHCHIPAFDKEIELNVEDFSTEIENIVSKGAIQTIDLIPPSIFIVEFKLSDGSSFSELSSGEKQRVYTASSLVYHIRNLISVENRKPLLRYDFINVVFDEIELYYHPEMQRTFISFLLDYLEKAKVMPQGLNICFITHSPLILSDIPSQNILFLTKEGLPYKFPDKINTFGANIHELLTDSFFLENGFIGSFAKNKIEQVIKALNDIKDNRANDEGALLTREKIDANKLKGTIDLIGEKFIREKLLDMFYGTFPEQFISDVARQERIAELENELMRLQDGYSTP